MRRERFNQLLYEVATKKRKVKFTPFQKDCLAVAHDLIKTGVREITFAKHIFGGEIIAKFPKK